MSAQVRQGWRMWRQGLLALLLALLFPAAAAAAAAAAASAQTFPKFTNFVVDQANIIPAEAERQLDHKLAGLQRRTRHQLAIVTVQSLQGYDISNYANHLGRTWGVGRRHYDDGVLMVVAPNEHKVRIEVGYGVEATLTDPRCAEIIRDQVLPRFKLQDFPGGINAGADAIIARLDRAAPLEKPSAS